MKKSMCIVLASTEFVLPQIQIWGTPNPQKREVDEKRYWKLNVYLNYDEKFLMKMVNYIII